MLAYPARIERVGDGMWVVSFRDVPGALTDGATFEEAERQAGDALATMLDHFDASRAPIPAPSTPLPGEVLVFPVYINTADALIARAALAVLLILGATAAIAFAVFVWGLVR